MNQPTVSPRWPSFLDAYLVAADSMGAPPVGVVRKDRNVWILRFGVPSDQQPREVFATRHEAGARLMELAQQE
jgi:hypothetical protein